MTSGNGYTLKKIPHILHISYPLIRPNDYFMEQLVELDNDLRKSRELEMKRVIHLPKIEELPVLPKPWHFEFWNEIPEDLPFDLSYRAQPLASKLALPTSISKRASVLSTVSSDWEWEYYDETDDESQNEREE